MKTRGYELPRKSWERIRKMDHRQMSQWAERFYTNAYQDGKKAAEGLSENEIKGVLLAVRGIGEKKAEAIMTAIKEAAEEKTGKERKIE